MGIGRIGRHLLHHDWWLRRYFPSKVLTAIEQFFQEAAPKIEVLPTDIEWHFIGGLQRTTCPRSAPSGVDPTPNTQPLGEMTVE